jgi:hypothetical protein
VPAAEKGGFNDRFRLRLAGEQPAPANRHEESLWRLTGIIEQEHPRDRFPVVYENLLRIQRAQEDSLALLRRGPADVLRLSFAKGGASVLTDAHMATDSLTAEQARFAFCWGVLLQLGDDLQDVREDRSQGLRTLFSEAAGQGTLDAVTSRTLHFARVVMAQMRVLPGAGQAELRQLIARSSFSLIIRSAGEAGEYYSGPYLECLEAASPFRFAFLAERRKQIGNRRLMLTRLFEAFLAGDDDEPAFPWMPGGF